MELILSFTAGIILTSLFFLIYLKKIAMEKGSFLKEKDLFHEHKKINTEKDLELERTKLHNAFLNGKEAGILEEKNKLQVRISPIYEKEDGFFNNSLHVGFTEEVIYNGFSIGEPTYRFLESYTKFNTENVEKIYKITLEHLTNVANNYIQMGIQSALNPTKEVISK